MEACRIRTDHLILYYKVCFWNNLDSYIVDVATLFQFKNLPREWGWGVEVDIDITNTFTLFTPLVYFLIC